MTASKGWAFRSENGRERISAQKVKVLREKNERKPLSDKFWSAHPVGRRSRLKHKISKNGTPFFSYMDEHAGGNDQGGISLSHLLYQEAIAKLKETELRLGKFGNHKVRITKATLEKKFDFETSYRSVDVYLQFESDSNLAKKWSGALAIEVHHTHPIPLDKVMELQKAKVAVVEVHVSDAFVFPYDEDVTTEELEAKHVDFLVKRLGEYIVGTVLSDPTSEEVLAEQLKLAKREIASGNEKQVQQAQEIAALNESNAMHRKHCVSLSARLQSTEDETTSLNGVVKEMQQEKKKMMCEIETLKVDLELRTHWLIATSVMSVCFLLLALYIRFIR